MAEFAFEKSEISDITLQGKRFSLIEQVDYPNGGYSRFYKYMDTALVVDHDICCVRESMSRFPYSLITDKQNHYMKKYHRLYRTMAQDLDKLKIADEVDYTYRSKPIADRADNADASPLEFLFEKKFTDVYGMSAIQYLEKEYGISDSEGNTYFLDYVVNTRNEVIAVEENGVTYHHPQSIGENGYRHQLKKQNACTAAGIKLYRFSTEDCCFENRIEDDIRSFFGENDTQFLKKGLILNRKIRLYEHQKDTLAEIKKQRREGTKSFLVVFPTASGKSKIVEEDIRAYAAEKNSLKVLILAPNTMITDDWNNRVQNSLADLKAKVEIRTFSYMTLHYHEYDQHTFDYIVVDEAHHAVAPGLKRVIQYFTPDFLIGLTATDKRPDQKKLEVVFGNYETNLSLIQAMQKGIVARANVFRIETNLNLSKVRINGKDYVNADLEKSIRVTSRNELIGDVLSRYFGSGNASNRQGIVFCVNVQHTKEMAKILTNRGIPARAYSSQEKNLDGIMKEFKEHKIRFLCACSMISEGWDYPEIGILVMARPTLSRVLYLQQIGRGLRKTDTKKNVFVIDVVDEYGAMAKPCTMHSVFGQSMYVPFGDITRTYQKGDMIEVDGIYEEVKSIIPVDIENFEQQYEGYLNQEQLAREFYMSTGSITSWIKKGKIHPSVEIPFGNKKIYLFSPESVQAIKDENQIAEHNDSTIHKDFFDFLEERDYSLSYKIIFLRSLIKHLNQIGDANIEEVLEDYVAFYQDRIDRGLPVDRKTCPYNKDTLKDKSMIRRNMLENPFEKFERKRFLYYSKNLGMISMNHALYESLTKEDYAQILQQMEEDLKNYYREMGS